MKVVAIGGSPRLSGNTNYLIDQALEELSSRGVETKKIVLNEYHIAPCQAHDNCASLKECREKDDGNWILEEFSQADGIILASPVYFSNISAQMKTFLDRTFFLFTHNIKLKAKYAAIFVTAGQRGTETTVDELTRYLGRIPGIEVLILQGSCGSPDTDPKEQTELIKQARDIGKQMAEKLTSQNDNSVD